MSYIPKVEGWIADLRRRMDPVPEDSPYYRELKGHLTRYEALLAELQGKHNVARETKREPGEEG